MAGFTVLEMALAMGIFSVIAAAAFGLMSQSQPLFNQQQGLAAVNIAIRNTTAQMQLDITNGARFTTYVIFGEPGQIQINGAAALLARPGDLVIVVAYAALAPEEIAQHRATVVQVDNQNRVTSTRQAAVTAP